MEDSHSDRRGFPRVRAVAYYRLGSVEHRHPIRDLSPLGIGVDSFDDLSPGQQLELHLIFLDGESLSLRAEVAWRHNGTTTGPTRYGLNFLDPTPEQRDRIQHNLVHLSDAPPPPLRRLRDRPEHDAPSDDQRSDQRHDLRAHCWLGAARTPGVLRDLSDGGLSVQTDSTLAVGAETSFEVLFPDALASIEGQGRVAWSEPVGGLSKKFNVGLRIVELSPYDRALLRMRFVG